MMPLHASPPESSRLVRFEEEREARALKHWEQTSKQWAGQLQRLSRATGARPEALNMQAHESKRQQTVTREVIDRAIPGFEGGKGHRVGSEFWNQQATSRKNLHYSVTRAQRGELNGVEYIGRPLAVQEEMGVGQPLRGWGDKSSYLASRKEALKETLNDIAPFEPDLNNLYV